VKNVVDGIASDRGEIRDDRYATLIITAENVGGMAIASITCGRDFVRC
jgi:hypothetical protein